MQVEHSHTLKKDTVLLGGRCLHWCGDLGHFRPYLYGRKFLLRTALCWLHNFKEPEGQVARWLETMAEFQYEVIHRPGKQHCNADSLSRGQCRQCGLEVELETDEMFPVCEISLLPAWTNQEVADFQRADTDLEQVIYLVAVRISTPTMSKGFDLATPIPLDSVQKAAVERWHSLQTVGGYPRRWSRSILAVSYPCYTHTRDHGWVA